MNDTGILKIVIMQMLEHNEVHGERYEEWTSFANTSRLDDVATLLYKAGKYSDS